MLLKDMFMKELLLVIGAYSIGNIMTGHLLGKIFYGREIRKEGSGNAGARNAGRILGKKAFVITFFGDALKGVAAVLFAKWLDFPSEWQLLVLFAVIIGHVFPVAFKFGGGKGMSTFIGGVLTFDPLLFSVFAGVFLIFYLIFRSLTLAGVVAVFFLPVLIRFFPYSAITILTSILLSAIIIFAHRQNIKEKIVH